MRAQKAMCISSWARVEKRINADSEMTMCVYYLTRRKKIGLPESRQKRSQAISESKFARQISV
jgi:hypothetical protein